MYMYILKMGVYEIWSDSKVILFYFNSFSEQMSKCENLKLKNELCLVDDYYWLQIQQVLFNKCYSTSVIQQVLYSNYASLKELEAFPGKHCYQS